MDATATERAVLVGLSAGAQWGSLLAAEHPERVLGAVFIGPAVWLGAPHPERAVHSFTEPLDTDEGWAKENVHYWRRDYRGYLEFFFGRVFTERHSTKQIEDCDRLGARDRPRDARRDAAGAHRRRARGVARGLRRASAARCS